MPEALQYPETKKEIELARILVVEDEADIANLLKYNLEKEGHQVDTVNRGEDCVSDLNGLNADLVILDLMLPGIQGLDVLRTLRDHPLQKDIPVIILSAKGMEADKVQGLELGADDYVTKPFAVKELSSRVTAVLRRSGIKSVRQNTFRYRSLFIDFDSVAVKVDDQEVHLSPYEFKILAFLVKNPGRAYSRDDLLNKVWEDGAFVQPRTVDVHIRRLRTLIEPDPKHPQYIQTVRGFGYIFRPE